MGSVSGQVVDWFTMAESRLYSDGYAKLVQIKVSQKISEGVLIHAIFNLPLARSHMYLTEPGCDRIKRLNRAVQTCVGYDAINRVINVTFTVLFGDDIGG